MLIFLSVGVYYVGYRESDIATDFNANETDDFFTGSITCYGRGKGTNVSYNTLSGMQFLRGLYGARNEAIYSKFISDQCQAVFAKDPDALFLPYSIYFAEKIPQDLQHRAICCNDEKVLMFLNSKINFKKFIDGKLDQAPFKLMKGSEIFDLMDNGVFPTQKEVVIQTEFGSGGEGTYICTKKNMQDKSFLAVLAEKIKPRETYIVADYIENLCSVGLQLQISDSEIGIYPPSIQILNGPKYIGSDIFAFSQLDEDVKSQCKVMGRKFGEMVRELGCRGFFGIDLIISKTGSPRVFAIETNPRFTGAVGLLNILCHKAGIGSVYEHSYKCFTNRRLDLVEFDKITPCGRSRYAEVERGEDGKVRSLDGGERNQEGLDKTVYHEEGFLYTHAVFEEVKKFNAFDDRAKYKKYVSNRKLP